MNTEFKKISEMTKEELKLLPKCSFDITKSLNRKTQVASFFIQFHLIKGSMTVSKRLTEAEFEIIKAKFGWAELNYNQFSGVCRYRLSRGTYQVSGEDYYLVEFVLDVDYYKNSFLSKDQGLQIKVCKLDEKGLIIVDRPAGTDEDDDLKDTFEFNEGGIGA